MDKRGDSMSYRTFLMIFAAMFILTVILPLMVDQILKQLYEGTVPHNDSIKVFKELINNADLKDKAISVIRRILKFM